MPAAALVRARERPWTTGSRPSPWTDAPVWIHGDLHPGNLMTHGGALAGIIDFGDVTAGDPAYDLAIAWLAFDGPGPRAQFIAASASADDADHLDPRPGVGRRGRAHAAGPQRRQPGLLRAGAGCRRPGDRRRRPVRRFAAGTTPVRGSLTAQRLSVAAIFSAPPS